MWLTPSTDQTKLNQTDSKTSLNSAHRNASTRIKTDWKIVIVKWNAGQHLSVCVLQFIPFEYRFIGQMVKCASNRMKLGKWILRVYRWMTSDQLTKHPWKLLLRQILFLSFWFFLAAETEANVHSQSALEVWCSVIRCDLKASHVSREKIFTSPPTRQKKTKENPQKSKIPRKKKKCILATNYSHFILIIFIIYIRVAYFVQATE